MAAAGGAVRRNGTRRSGTRGKGTLQTAVRLARRYPLVAATLVVGTLGLILVSTPAAPTVPWALSIFALAVAAREGWGMLRSLMRGHVGLDILAVMAIVSTVAVGEYWASIVIVLMLAGGEALEDYAAGRAQRELRSLLDRVPQLAHRIGRSAGSPDLAAGGGVANAGAATDLPGKAGAANAGAATGRAVTNDGGAGDGEASDLEASGLEASGLEASDLEGSGRIASTGRASDGAATNGDTTLEDVPIDDVRIGDRLLVRPAEIVPVDGVLASPEASLDESSLTGESLPVEKHTGDALVSGSVNGPVAIEIVATALARDSQYQRIVELVREASASKAPLVRLADRYAVPFTVVSLAIAGVAWAISGDPVRFAEVLVVATPCPLLIAAPVAFMAGMSSAARFGVVVKNAGTLEKLARARTIAFDKTGTLTHGMPQVVSVNPAPGFSANEIFTLVGTAEKYSSHVLAAALREAAIESGLTLGEATSAREVATHGVDAVIGGRRVVVGKPAFVASLVTGLERLELGSGEAAVYVGVDGAYAGAIVLRDLIREEAVATLADIRSMGVVRSLMLTGDVEQTATPIAEQLGLTDVRAECLPEDKVRVVRDIQPRPVVMVGDGVNDAPVLAVADVGIAMGAKGSTAASESADVVILLDDLSRVATAISVGKRTVYIAKQSIWVGIAISVGLMLVATVGVLPAIIGAALQEVVDLITILNALRARGAGRRAQGGAPRAGRGAARAWRGAERGEQVSGA